MNTSNLEGAFEKTVSGEKSGKIILRLFVAGLTPPSQVAIHHLKKLCEEFWPGHYRFEVIDIYQQPEFALEEQMIATPTLIRHQPMAKRILIGDLSRKERVVNRLGLGL